jgi:creatinine amidohydrolase/Fe(II)-dependent formamide hydrolase-like protein
MLLHLAPESVRQDKIKSEIARTNKLNSKYLWSDLFSSGPMNIVERTSQYSESGVMGEAEKATAEKGRLAFEEASKNLAGFVQEYYDMEIVEPSRRQEREPTFPLSFPTD